MKKFIILVLALVCVLGLVGCNQLEELRQGDNNTQYFFTAKVIEVNEEYLVLEVFDTGNTNLSDGTLMEVSTEVVAAKGCPEFSVDECARVLMARNIEDKANERLKALSIYKTDENGKVITDSKEKFPSIRDVSQMKYSEVNEALSGKAIQEIRDAWGEPAESDGKEDVWQLDESMLLEIAYNDTGIVESCELVCGTPLAPTTENETISFHDKTFNKSDLSQETIEWLENYNSLSEDEQLAISYIPAELYELCGYPTAEETEVPAE